MPSQFNPADLNRPALEEARIPMLSKVKYFATQQVPSFTTGTRVQGDGSSTGAQINAANQNVNYRDVKGGPGAIGFSVMRGGGIVGEHSVTFAAEDEILTLSHSARDRGLFARGAVVAARWVAGRPPGQYDMRNVLGFSGRS